MALRKPFRTFARVGKKTLITVKNFCRWNREKGREGVEKLKGMTSSVVKQAQKVVKSLYNRRRKDLAKTLNKAVSLGRKIVNQTEQVLKGEKMKGRIYSLHEPDVVAIEPVIGHLKNDHRMNRCRYKGVQGDTADVAWAALAWNTKKIVQLAAEKEEKDYRLQRKRSQVRAAA